MSIDRDRVVSLPETVVLTYDHAALTATTTVKLFKVPTGRSFRVDRSEYINPTGLAENASNAFAVELKNGSTVVANGIDTDSDEPGADNSIPADTFVTMTLAATPVLAAGDILSVVFTEDGTATLPAGRLVVTGRFV